MDAIREVLGNLLRIDPEGAPFAILLGIGAGALFFFGKLIAEKVVGSKGGFPAVFLGMALPCLIAVICLAAAQLYLLPRLPSGPASMAAQIAVGLAALLLSSLVFSRKLIDVGWGKAILALVLSLAVAWGCVFISRYGLEAFSQGSKTVKSYQERTGG